MEQNITYVKLIKELRNFATASPFINSFGQGNLIDFSKTDDNTTPQYPMMFVIPISFAYNDKTTEYGVQIIFADRLNDDLMGNEYTISNMSQVARDLIGQVKLGNLIDVVDISYPVLAQPFQERFNDVVAGVSMDITFIVSDFNDICQFDIPYLTTEDNITLTTEDGTPITIE